MLTILGPTATGKTALAARVAFETGGEVISADSRQVYRGMNIGTGKDYEDYIVEGVQIPCHLTDLVDPGYEYNIFEYQKDFLKVYQDIISRKKIPVLCGGSGMYLEAVLKGYRLARVDQDDVFIAGLQDKTDEELIQILKSYKTLHNITDLEERARIIKAIRIARAGEVDAEGGIREAGGGKRDTGTGMGGFPAIEAVIVGISFPRGLVKSRIRSRLEYRLHHGMIEEVEGLLAGGISPERLMKYGLEYKFITLFLTGKMSRTDLFNDLYIAICQFSKRQMTWFRRMEKQGMRIHWIDGRLPFENKVAEIKSLYSARPSRF